MKLKLFAAFAFLLVVAIGVTITASRAKQKPVQQQVSELEERENRVGLTLEERVRLAKLKGQHKLVVPKSHRTSMYVGFKDMDTAAAVYAIIIAKPVAAIGRLDDEGRIVTSYKFKTVEVLSEPAPSRFPHTFSGELPDELQPFEKDEFMVTTLGGTTVVDGVEVTTKYDDYEAFSLSKNYLMFLDFDTTHKVGGMDMGPLSALTIDDDGSMTTLDRNQSHEIKQALDTRFGNSISQLKSHLQNRGKTQE
jgi:hypothetical protein